MITIKKYTGRSLAARLSIIVVSLAALIFVAALTYLFLESRRAVKREAIEHATQLLDNTVLRVSNILDNAAIAADNIDWLVYRQLDDPDAMFDLSRNVILNNPSLQGCSISFRPYFYPEKGQYYSIYSSMQNGSVHTEQEGDDEYQYFYMDWYQLPRLLSQPCWTEPYMDVDAETGNVEMVTSYCKPLIGDDGEFAGSLSVDLSLEWLSETISAVKPYPNSYSVVLGRGGTYLVHPDPEKLMYQTIFTETLETPNPAVSALGHSMMDGEEGMRMLEINGEQHYVFYKPVKTTNWSVAIICPEKDIFGGFSHLQRIVLAIVLVGLLLTFLGCTKLITRELVPLRQLADQTDTIAAGRFDETLPDPKHDDEIGQLTRSFEHMQTSLVSYIDELTETTASKERIEGELRIARDIQMSMVPRVFPPFPERQDIDLYASMTPAKEVGGDLYDYLILRNKLYFCIGDVSGKGVPGSLLMAVTRNLFRVVLHQNLPPAEIARLINETISADNEQMMFMTMFIGIVDLATGKLEFCNCGHNPPVIMGKNGPEFMQVLPNVPLGISTGIDFQSESVPDIREIPLLFYTDGLNEAENIEHEQFGDDRILEVLRSTPFTSAQATIEDLSASLAEFVGEAEPSDDLTMVCLKIRAAVKTA